MKFNTDEDVAEKTNVKYWKSSYIILFYFMRYTREKIEVWKEYDWCLNEVSIWRLSYWMEPYYN